MIERAKALSASVPRLLPLAAFAFLAACATGGTGSNPPLPGTGPKSGSSGGTSGDDGSGGELQGDDAGDVDAVASGDDAATPSDPAATCNDALHGLKALFVLPPKTCTNSVDCSAGECCFVGASGSTCVMQ